MYRDKSRVVPIIIILLVVVVAIVALVSVGRAIFGGGESDAPDIDVGRDTLLSTSVDNSVSMAVRGPIVADENFLSYQLEISSESRDLTVYSGYNDAVLDSINLDNNHAAYEQFVYALDKANFMEGDVLPEEQNDLRGICATGLLQTFAVVDSGETAKQLWTSECDGSPGSLEASQDQLANLFLAQIPDSQDFLSEYDLD